MCGNFHDLPQYFFVIRSKNVLFYFHWITLLWPEEASSLPSNLTRFLIYVSKDFHFLMNWLFFSFLTESIPQDGFWPCAIFRKLLKVGIFSEVFLQIAERNGFLILSGCLIRVRHCSKLFTNINFYPYNSSLKYVTLIVLIGKIKRLSNFPKDSHVVCNRTWTFKH